MCDATKLELQQNFAKLDNIWRIESLFAKLITDGWFG